MNLLLEPSLTTFSPMLDHPGSLAGRSLGEWNDAYVKVECYLHALRVRNKLLLGQLVIDILNRAMLRAPFKKDCSATELAVEEMDRAISGWFGEVLEEPSDDPDDMLSTRGRLALMLADMPGKWQDQFLRPAPWPEEFVVAMRDAYLRAGPDFQLSQMTPRPLDLGPVSALSNLSRLPMFKFMAVSSWVVFGAGLVAIFFLTH